MSAFEQLNERGMTDKEAKAILIDKVKPCLNGTEWETALDIAIKALEQQPCPNAISRSDMLDAIGHGTTYTSEDLQGIIKDLQPVKPQYTDAEIQKMQELEQAEIQKAYELGKPKTGHWIWNDEKGYCKCSKCGIGMGHTEFDYCPNCGAKMLEIPTSSESNRTCHTCKHYTSGEYDGSCGSYICKGYSNWESEDKE